MAAANSNPFAKLARPDQSEPDSVSKSAPPPWLTVEEAAAYSGLPASFLLGLVESRRLPALDVGLGPDGYRVRRLDVDAITATRQAELPSAAPGIDGSAPDTAERKPIQRETQVLSGSILPAPAH